MRVISGNARGTKLKSIENIETRPTLDRVKESLFNIIQNKIYNSDVLDLFAGSGAIGIECISRCCKSVHFCEKSNEAYKIIYENLEKTNFLSKSIIMQLDYKKCLGKLNESKLKFDIIYIDPPYNENIAVDSVKKILEFNLLKKEGIIIIETDDDKRELLELEKLKVKVYDLRKYGRIKLLFLSYAVEVGKECV